MQLETNQNGYRARWIFLQNLICWLIVEILQSVQTSETNRQTLISPHPPWEFGWKCGFLIVRNDGLQTNIWYHITDLGWKQVYHWEISIPATERSFYNLTTMCYWSRTMESAWQPRTRAGDKETLFKNHWIQFSWCENVWISHCMSSGSGCLQPWSLGSSATKKNHINF